MRRAALGILIALATACSSPEEPGAPPPTLDEKKAIAEAEAMIPASEPPSATPAATETPRDDQ